MNFKKPIKKTEKILILSKIRVIVDFLIDV